MHIMRIRPNFSLIILFFRHKINLIEILIWGLISKHVDDPVDVDPTSKIQIQMRIRPSRKTGSGSDPRKKDPDPHSLFLPGLKL